MDAVTGLCTGAHRGVHSTGALLHREAPRAVAVMLVWARGGLGNDSADAVACTGDALDRQLAAALDAVRYFFS